MESNSLLETIKFADMTSDQKTEVLSKIIQGNKDPYKMQNLKITMKLSASPSNPVLWKGKILNADHGLMKISTTVQGKKWNDFKSTGNYGVVYLGKDLFMIVDEKTIDSLAISVEPDYQSIYVDCKPQECLQELAPRLKHGGSIGKLEFKNGNVVIEYVKNYKDYQALQPQSKVTKEQWEDYFESGDGLEKTLVDTPVRIMKELDFVTSVQLLIPFNGKSHRMAISRELLEEFTKMDIGTIRKGWNEKFIDEYVYNKINRAKFITQFKVAK